MVTPHLTPSSENSTVPRFAASRTIAPSARAAIDREIDTILAHPIFQTDSTSQDEDATALAYRRFAHFTKHFNIDRQDVLRDSDRLVAAHERTATIDGTLCTILSIHYSLCLGTLLELGEDRLDLEPLICELERVDAVGVFLATELGFGNNVASLETRAEYDAERQEFLLTSPTPESRKFMPNTAFRGVPKVAVVMARLIVDEADHGVFPFVVRIRDKSGPCQGVQIVTLGEKPGFALDNAMTVFRDCRLPFSSLLTGGIAELHPDGRFKSSIEEPRRRFLYFMDRVQSGRVLLTNAASKLATSLVAVALNYASQRRSFSPVGDIPISSFRNVQLDLFGALATAHASGFAMQRAIELMRMRRGSESRSAFRAIAAMKAVTSYAAADSVAICRERCGAAGMFSENGFLDAWVMTQGIITAEGDNQMMLMKVGRQLALEADVPDSNHSTAPMAAENFVARPEQLMRLVERQEHKLIHELRNTFASQNDADPLDRLNSLVCPLIEVGRAHGRTLTARAFFEGITSGGAGGDSAGLGLLFRLWALSQIKDQASWFLSQGVIEASGFDLVQKERIALCNEVSPRTDSLIFALQIPKSALSGPLANRDYVLAYAARGAQGAA